MSVMKWQWQDREFDDPVADAALERIEPEPEPPEQPERPFTNHELGSLGLDLYLLRRMGVDLEDHAVIQQVLAARARRRERAAQGDTSWEDLVRSHTEPREIPVRESIVYYMRLGNRVKIGRTTNLRSRLEAIGAEEVLATEPGGNEVEQMRHRQFAALRTHREWFRLEEPLTSHIAKLGII